MLKAVLFLVSLAIFHVNVFGQDDDYDEEHLVSSLPNFSRVHSNIEFYQFNGNEHAFHWVTNGKLEIGDSDYLNLELIGAYYNNDGATTFTPGDFSVSYTRNFYSRKFLNSGFQGVSSGVKLIIPTGDANNSALFGHWIAEPSVQYSWLLKNEKFFIRNRWRGFFPIYNSSKWSKPPMYIRFEPQFGYENIKYWASLTLDNRLIFNQNEFVIFTRLDAGYKLNDVFGLSAFYTQRVYNTVLFKTYMGAGLYYNF